MPNYRVDPFDLRLFAAAVDGGSITLGARAVHLSLAAASERLQALEHALGVVLLVRSKRGVRPTDAGQALRRYAGRVLMELDSLYSEMAPFARGVRGTVKLLSNTAAVSEFLPEVLGRFLARHPDIDVELQERWSHEILEMIRVRRADIGIVADTVDVSGLAVSAFREDRLVLVRPPGRKGRRQGSGVRFAEVLDQPFVGLTQDSALSRFLQDQASRSGQAIHHRVRVKGFEAMAHLVEAGVGVAVMPQRTAQRAAVGKLEICALLDDWATRRLLLCRPAEAPQNPCADALWQALSAHEPGSQALTGEGRAPRAGTEAEH